LEIARGYLKRGWNPIPVSRQKKKPAGGNAWQKRRLNSETVAEAFNGADMNVGVQMGPMSDGLTDIDLDCREAVAIGGMLLPKSNNIFGRASKRRSHWLYSSTLAERVAKACLQFKDPAGGAMMLELKIGGGGKGAQSVFPGSVHESGEVVEWDQDGALVTTDDDELLRQVRRLAVTVMLARHWPVKGGRHDAALTVGGFLARAGVDEDDAALMLEAIATAAGDDEVADRVQAGRDAVKQHGNGGETRGYPALAETFDQKVATKAAQWLDYRCDPHLERGAGRQRVFSCEDFYALMTMENRFIYAPTGARWPGSNVDAQIASVLVGKRKMNASTWIARNRPVADMTWMPGQSQIIENRLVVEGGWIERPGVKCFNLYHPPTIKHGDPAKAGSWINHLRELYPDEAEHIMLWFAHRVQRPGVKINHALALIGGQGIGKDTILEPVRYAVGPWNFKDVRPADLFAPQNDFVQSIILCINEVHDLGDISRYEFYDKTKSYAAAPPDTIRVNAKYTPQYWVFNLTDLILTSNHKTDGLYLPADDRRHYVAYSELKGSDFPKSYFDDLHGWYEGGGFSHVAAYLATLDISKFNPKAPPPKTPAFWAIVDANRAPEDAELADVLDKLGKPNAVTLIQLMAVTKNGLAEIYLWLKDRKNRRIIPHRMEKCGYIPVRNDAAEDGLWKIEGKRQVIYVKNTLPPVIQHQAARKIVKS
jgi:hypothetical protein